ncbi:MAG: efflux RND transporter periplasmic adaptor subunit [Halocynthiibacter sp.]
MRIFSIVTATLVCIFLLIFTLKRDWVSLEEPAPNEVAKQAEQTDMISVVTRHSEAQSTNQAVLLRGQTEAIRQVEVRAETSSTVISEPLRKGQYVKEGQSLCTLDAGARGASLAEAKARLAEAEINAKAADKLKQGGFASETRALSASAGLQAAQAGVEAATKEMARLDITAPFDGLLETDTAELGSLLQPGALCATVIQLDTIKLVGFVPETQVDKISIGAQAGARLSNGDELAGRVTFISRRADPQTRTFRAEIQVPNPDFAIRDGQTAEILISAEGQDAHLLPLSALTLNNQGDLGVRTVVDETVQFVPVTMIRDTTEGVWLTGLPPVSNVIIIGQEFVTDGVKVRTVDEGMIK